MAPRGPSNGISDIVNARDAPLIERISNGFSRSADNGVVIICTSLRKPFGNNGLSGLSVRRQISIASVLGLPSLLKKLPGIFPRAYILSSKSIVKGKKSIPGLAAEVVAVTSIIESPYLSVADPFAFFANFPVSTDKVLFAMVNSYCDDI